MTIIQFMDNHPIASVIIVFFICAAVVDTAGNIFKKK